MKYDLPLIPVVLVQYNSKQLGVLILTVEHNYICLWYYRRIITTTCFGPICVGHLQVVTGLSGQLYRNVWSVLGEFWGWGGGRSRYHYNSGYHGPGFYSGGLPLVACSAPFFPTPRYILYCNYVCAYATSLA